MCKGHRADDGRRRVACNAGQFVQSNTGLFCVMRIYVLHGLDPFSVIDSVRSSDQVVRQVASSFFDFLLPSVTSRDTAPDNMQRRGHAGVACLEIQNEPFQANHHGWFPRKNARGVHGRRQPLSCSNDTCQCALTPGGPAKRTGCASTILGKTIPSLDSERHDDGRNTRVVRAMSTDDFRCEQRNERTWGRHLGTGSTWMSLICVTPSPAGYP